MKKLINDPERVVIEQLEGMGLACSDPISMHFDPDFVYRADAPVEGKVAVIWPRRSSGQQRREATGFETPGISAAGST